MNDCDGNSLVIGDIVWYRKTYASEYDCIGIVKQPDTSQYLTILTTSHMFLEKRPENVRKMSDENAMIWKLENV